MKYFLGFIINTGKLLGEVSPFLLLGFFFAGILHGYIGENLIKKHLGKGNLFSILKSIALGIPLPLCSCGVIPVAGALKRSGARESSILAFLFATPTTGVDSILATYAFLGVYFAVFRPIAAFIGGLFIGLMALLLEGKRGKIEKVAYNYKRRKGGFLDTLNYGFLYLPKEIGKWLLIGVIIGGAITTLLPDNMFRGYLLNPYISYPLMLTISIPIYVCATGSIPIAASLVFKGLSPGAALVFLIGGPATNAINLTFLWKEFGKKLTISYLIGVIIVAVLSGLVFDIIWKLAGQNPSFVMGAGRHLPLYLKTISASIILLLTVIPGVKFNRKTREDKMKYKFRVPDIRCMGCVDTIKNEVGNLPGIKDVKVDLNEKIVWVDGEVDINKIINTIEEAGYTVKEKEVLDN